mgnify:CR=1 FL=1
MPCLLLKINAYTKRMKMLGKVSENVQKNRQFVDFRGK